MRSLALNLKARDRESVQTVKEGKKREKHAIDTESDTAGVFDQFRAAVLILR